MIAKIINSKSSCNLLSYLLEKEHEIVNAKGVLPNLNIEEFKKSFKSNNHLNKRVQNTTSHIILSFPRSDVVEYKLNNIIHDLVNEIFPLNEMWLAIKHPDTDTHQHLHIAINKITSNGKVLNDSNSALRAIEFCRQLEATYDLQKVHNDRLPDGNSQKKHIKDIIDCSLNMSTNYQDFVTQLLKKDIVCKRGRGITFINKKNGVQFKGSAIGREYSLNNLLKNFEVQTCKYENPKVNSLTVSNISFARNENENERSKNKFKNEFDDPNEMSGEIEW